MGETSFDILIDDMAVPYQATYISKHLPEKIREYFLFDGEQLEKYFRDDNRDIKIAVKKLSQLNLLERISRHISNREDEYVDKLKQLNPALGRVLKKEKSLKESLESKQKLLNDTEENLSRWEIIISNLENELMNYGSDPNRLIELRKQAENDLKKKEESIKNLESKYNTFLLDSLPKILAVNSLLEVKGICNYLEEKGYIPARFKKEFLEYLLESHECICGADLSEGTDAYNKMKQLYDETDETTNIADTVNILLGGVNSIINNFPKNFKTRFDNYNLDKERLIDERDALSKQVSDIDSKLSSDAQVEVQNIQKDLNKYRSLFKNASIKKGKLEQQIEDIKKDLSNISTELEKEKGKEALLSDIQTSIDFCKQVKSEAKRIYKELETDIQIKLQELTAEEFKKMHWKEFYNGVSIDSQYNVTIHKPGGDIVPNDLSKGGQLILALSFMTALNSLSGFELPIIDTPMGRLDEPIKENIGKSLPYYTKGKQVTLLVTGSEYSKNFKKGIRDFVGKNYVFKLCSRERWYNSYR